MIDPPALRAFADALRTFATAVDAAAQPVPPPVVEPEPPVVEPPPVVVSPEPEPEPPVASEWSSLPFANELPAMPNYTIPGRAGIDWVIQAGQATSTRGLGSKVFRGGSIIGDLYRASRLAGHTGTVTVGVMDWGGVAIVGGKWDAGASHSVCNGSEPVRLKIVGMTRDAEVSLGWSTTYSRAEWLAVINIGIRGQDDSFIIRANDGAGTVIMDGCWWVQNPSWNPYQRHTSGLHCDLIDKLVIRNHKFKGCLFQEHSFYFKSMLTSMHIVGNDLRGGNRTGFQIRPGADTHNPVAPSCKVVIADNYADGYGFTHGTDPSTAGGGGCISVWSSPNQPVFVFNNQITDARYGCFMASGQPNSAFQEFAGVDRNWYGDFGYPIDRLVLYGNTFENHRGNREAVSISSVRQVEMYANNVVGAGRGIVFDAQWALDKACPSRVSAKRNGSVSFIGGIPSSPAYKIGVDGHTQRDLTSSELQNLVQ